MANKKDPRQKKLFQPLNAEIDNLKVSKIKSLFPKIKDNESLQITKVVQGYFDSVSKTTLDKVEQLYPKTLRALFYLAWQIHQGFCGKNIKEKFLLDQTSGSTWNNVMPLFVYSLSKTGMKIFSEGAFPEIFIKIKKDPRWRNIIEMIRVFNTAEIEQMIFGNTRDLKPKLTLCKVAILDLERALNNDPDNMKGLILMFDHYLDHLTNPSSFLIQLFLQMKFKNKALSWVGGIKNSAERSKALSSLTEMLIEQNDFTKAIEQWNLISTQDERLRISHLLLEKMIEGGYQNETLRFLSQIKNKQESDENYKNASLVMTERRNYEQTNQFLDKISNADIKDSALSNIVNVLAHQNQFDKAKEAAFSIKDPGFREDAMIFIVKAYMHSRNLDEAIRFVNSIPNPKEKRRPAKIIEIILKSFHQDEKVKSLHKIFSLMPTPARHAA
jgi:hypothetical protein